MATLLMGHGGVDLTEKVLVPEGLSVSFIIDAGRVATFSNAVSTVRLGPQALLEDGYSLSSTHVGPATIDNHELQVLSSDQRAWYAQVDPEDGSCFYAGENLPSPSRLCTDPGVDGACMQAGEHSCDGLLARDWSDPDLYWVACRQDMSGNYSRAQFSIGSEAGGAQAATEFVETSKAARELLAADENAFIAYWDALTDEEQVPMLSQPLIDRWVRQRQARAWLAEGTTARDFYAFLHGHTAEERALYLKGDTTYQYPVPRDLVDAYAQGEKDHFVEGAREYLATQGTDNFRLWVTGLDPTWRAAITEHDDLAALLAGASAADRFGMTVDEIDWSTVQGINETTLKDAAAGTSVPYWQRPSGELLIGTDQPETYRKLLEFERTPGQDPTGRDPLGRITVTARGSVTSKGSLSISGPANRDVATSWIGAFSSKKLTFTG